MGDENAKALFRPVKGKGEEVTVHFNPVSLQLAITNTLDESAQDKKQYVTKSVAKLTMDLIFDTTDTGQDVRIHTEKVAAFMEPGEKKIPTIVQFEWGTYKFQGLIDSYKETIDFFAPTGVPLRATVNLTLSRQEKVFEKSDPDKKLKAQQSLAPEAVEVPSRANQDSTSLGAQGGNPQAGRGIAAANGLESMRFSAGASLTVGASVQLGAPAAFASGGAGLSLGGGVGVSGGAGLSIEGGAGLSLGGGAGVSIGAGAGLSIGGSASAGVSASEGAFAGLRTQASSKQTASVDTSLLIKRSESLGVATDSGASFSVGGKARIEGSTSLSADVGASASLKARIQFED